MVSHIESLPDEIVMEIVSFLPLVDVINLSITSIKLNAVRQSINCVIITFKRLAVPSSVVVWLNNNFLRLSLSQLSRFAIPMTFGKISSNDTSTFTALIKTCSSSLNAIIGRMSVIKSINTVVTIPVCIISFARIVKLFPKSELVIATAISVSRHDYTV